MAKAQRNNKKPAVQQKRVGARPAAKAKQTQTVQRSAQRSDIELIAQTEKQKKAQRSRSIALALALVAFVVIVYIGTWAKLGPVTFVRPM